MSFGLTIDAREDYSDSLTSVASRWRRDRTVFAVGDVSFERLRGRLSSTVNSCSLLTRLSKEIERPDTGTGTLSNKKRLPALLYVPVGTWHDHLERRLAVTGASNLPHKRCNRDKLALSRQFFASRNHDPSVSSPFFTLAFFLSVVLFLTDYPVSSFPYRH